MKLLVTGANGQIGWELRTSLAALGNVTALDRSQCDLSRPSLLPDIVRSVRPDVIVNAAAYTAVDDAEQDEARATAVNGAAPGVLACEAARAGALMIHYSTDYVFDGRKATPYTEDDPPCPVNAYGRSKLVGEAAVEQAGGAHLILRTSWVYGVRGRNFLRTMLALLRERDELRIVADQIGAPTWATEIAQATAAVVQAATHERAEGRFTPGLFHLTAAGATSWHGFAAAILAGATRRGMLAATGRAPRLVPVRSEEYPRPAARPKNSRLAGGRIRGRFGVALPGWEEGLEKCLEEMRMERAHEVMERRAAPMRVNS
jgi:dTDP-4-dehydrorhamnose reductase